MTEIRLLFFESFIEPITINKRNSQKSMLIFQKNADVRREGSLNIWKHANKGGQNGQNFADVLIMDGPLVI